MKSKLLSATSSNVDLESAGWYLPKLNLTETDQDLVLTMEVPGVTEHDIKIDLRGRRLFVSGEKTTEQESDVIGYTYFERRYGAFQRVVDLPCEVDAERTVATINNGVLTVLLPKVGTDAVSKVITVKKQ